MKQKKTKLKYDNIFIATSILFLGTLFLIYSCRFIYFFAIEKKKPNVKNSTFSEILIHNETSLLKDGNKYIYYGKDANNYVYYSGIMFRIVSIEDGYIKLVTDEPITSLVMNYDNDDFSKSYVNIWLNKLENEDNSGKFEDMLVDKSKYLVNTKTCIDTTDDYSKKCKKYNTDYLVGILSIDEYMNAYSNNSYLNTGDYFWLSNKASNDNFWYVYTSGGLSSKSKTEVTYHSFGVRPTITLNKNVYLLSGTGTKTDPYIFQKNDSKMLVNRNIGEYVSYASFKWRIVDVFDGKVKLALADALTLNDEDVYKLYDLEGSKFYNSNFYTYLNNNFYRRLTDTSLIIKGKWYDGKYNEENNYDYRNIYTDYVEAKVGTLNIGDNFIYDVDNSFLMTPAAKETIYSIQENKVYIDHMSNKLRIRPAIYIDGSVNISGDGTYDNPFVIEGE